MPGYWGVELVSKAGYKGAEKDGKESKGCEKYMLNCNMETTSACHSVTGARPTGDSMSNAIRKSTILGQYWLGGRRNICMKVADR